MVNDWSICRQDRFCRCRDCKPDLPGALLVQIEAQRRADQRFLVRLKVFLLIMLSATAILVTARALGAW